MPMYYRLITITPKCRLLSSPVGTSSARSPARLLSSSSSASLAAPLHYYPPPSSHLGGSCGRPARWAASSAPTRRASAAAVQAHACPSAQDVPGDVSDDVSWGSVQASRLWCLAWVEPEDVSLWGSDSSSVIQAAALHPPRFQLLVVAGRSGTSSAPHLPKSEP